MNLNTKDMITLIAAFITIFGCFFEMSQCEQADNKVFIEAHQKALKDEH